MELLVASEEGTKPVNYHNEEGIPCSSECVVAVDIERHSAAKIKVEKERWGEEGGRERQREMSFLYNGEMGGERGNIMGDDRNYFLFRVIEWFILHVFLKQSQRDGGCC